MLACLGKVQGLPRAELERMAAGQGTDMECEVQAAQMLLYSRPRVAQSTDAQALLKSTSFQTDPGEKP